MTSNVHHPLHRSRCNLAELRTNSAFGNFVTALEERLKELRDMYESEEASEFTRGQVNAIKDILNNVADQNIR